MSHKQLPLALLSVSLSVLRRKFAVAIQQRQAIAHDVPFRMTAATFLQVGREGSVSECSESLANRLAFFAGYQYIHFRKFSVITPSLIGRAGVGLYFFL